MVASGSHAPCVASHSQVFLKAAFTQAFTCLGVTFIHHVVTSPFGLCGHFISCLIFGFCPFLSWPHSSLDSLSLRSTFIHHVVTQKQSFQTFSLLHSRGFRSTFGNSHFSLDLGFGQVLLTSLCCVTAHVVTWLLASQIFSTSFAGHYYHACKAGASHFLSRSRRVLNFRGDVRS